MIGMPWCNRGGGYLWTRRSCHWTLHYVDLTKERVLNPLTLHNESTTWPLLRNRVNEFMGILIATKAPDDTLQSRERTKHRLQYSQGWGRGQCHQDRVGELLVVTWEQFGDTLPPPMDLVLVFTTPASLLKFIQNISSQWHWKERSCVPRSPIQTSFYNI